MIERDVWKYMNKRVCLMESSQCLYVVWPYACVWGAVLEENVRNQRVFVSHLFEWDDQCGTQVCWFSSLTSIAGFWGVVIQGAELSTSLLSTISLIPALSPLIIIHTVAIGCSIKCHRWEHPWLPLPLKWVFNLDV